MSELATYKIGTVSAQTGLSAHVIRVWERRYQAITPARTPKGGRLFSENDVAKLRLLKQLVDSGLAISSVARLTSDELLLLSSKTLPPENLDNQEDYVAEFLAAVSKLDVERGGALLNGAAAFHEPLEFVELVLSPISIEIGRRWEEGTIRISQEHAASMLMRESLVSMTKTFAASSNTKVVVGTFPEERHEFGALTVSMLATMHGWSVVYLGTEVPPEDLIFACKATGAKMILSSLVSLDRKRAQPLLEQCEEILPDDVRLVIGGVAAARLKRNKAELMGLRQLNELLSKKQPFF